MTAFQQVVLDFLNACPKSASISFCVDYGDCSLEGGPYPSIKVDYGTPNKDSIFRCQIFTELDQIGFMQGMRDMTLLCQQKQIRSTNSESSCVQQACKILKQKVELQFVLYNR